MATSDVQLNLNLAFPNAGVVFNISVDSPEGSNGSGASFRLNVTDATGGSAVPLRVDASPELADWVRGYSRWLVRAHVRATFDESAITGTYSSDVTPEQVLVGIREACDMIHQRFDMYTQSVLA